MLVVPEMTEFRLYRVGLALNLAANPWNLAIFHYEFPSSRLP
jgi:hypothetical protein